MATLRRKASENIYRARNSPWEAINGRFISIPTAEDMNSSYVSVFVVLLSLSDGTDVQATFHLTLLDQSGKARHKMRSSSSCNNFTLKQRHHMWGYKRYFKKCVFENSDYLRDDCIKFYCTVGVVVESAIDSSRLCSIQVPDSAPTSTPSCLVKETMSGSNLFVLEGYSMTKGIGAGKHIESEEFWVGGYKWAICFYPQGKNPEDNSTHMSVFIKLVSEGRDVQAMFELTLMDQSGKGNHKIGGCFNQSLPKMLKWRGSMWGYNRFCKRHVLEMSDYLRDDCLKMYCTIGVISAIDSSRFRSIHVPDSDIGLHIGMLLKNMEGCDITFNVCGEKTHAHKLILAARSPKLIQGMDTEEVMVADMEPKVFKALLHFIYTDGLAEKEEIASETLTAKLLAAADRHELERLKRLCESHLCKYITVNSVVDLLVLADGYNAAELKDVCLNFAAQNLTAVMRSDGFKRLEENSPSLKSEFLNSVGGCGDDCSSGGGNNTESVSSSELSDGGDNSGQRVIRQEGMEEGTSNEEVELEGFKCLEIGT